MSEKSKSNVHAGGPRLRHARMQIESTVLLNRAGDSYPTELEDISATGVRLRRPADWRGELGQTWVVDMIFGSDLNIHVDACIMRVSDEWIGLEYARIPEDKQEALWNLLGGYADKLETWDDND